LFHPPALRRHTSGAWRGREGDDGYQAFEQALDKIEKRVRRYKNRLRDHRPAKDTPAEMAAERIILPSPAAEGGGELDETDSAPDGQEGDAPAIVAESDTELRTMTVSMAVLQLELSDSPAVLFRNAAHGRLNMVYRRPDGNFGWVDPEKGG